MRTPTVLVADDHADSRLVYTAYLRYCGFEVLDVEDGRTALELARTRLPDAVVLDYHMDDMNAGQVMRALKADARTAAIPALVATADVTAATRRDAEQAGCDDFVLKPCEPRDLVHRVAALIARTPLMANATLSITASTLRPVAELPAA